jgi:hypothetical protein
VGPRRSDEIRRTRLVKQLRQKKYPHTVPCATHAAP